MINKVNTLNPKVVSLDVAFSEYSGDANDKALFLALRSTKKLVLPSEITYLGKDYWGQEMILVSLTCASEFFVLYTKTGFISAKIEKEENQIIKQFIVWQKGSYDGSC